MCFAVTTIYVSITPCFSFRVTGIGYLEKFKYTYMSLVTYQHITDMHKKGLQKVLHDEILAHHKLKIAWGLGHIRCKIDRCSLGFYKCAGKLIGNKKHLVVFGYYSTVQK